MRKFLLMAAAMVCGLAPLAQAADAPAGEFAGEIELVLWGAVFQGPVPRQTNQNLVLELESREGRWQRIHGFSQSYSNGLHMGLVEQAKASAQEMTLKLNMVINGDQWNRGTYRGGYDVTLKRDGEGTLSGTYEGIFKGSKVSGRATARIKPARAAAKAFKPVEAGEHPRALFRRDEIPELRKRLATPFGKAYIARAEQSADPVNLGVLYALTGEKRYAEAAQAIVQKYLADPDTEFLTEKGAGSGGFGHTLVATALAMDLCYDAWPAEFRGQVQSTMSQILPRLMRYCMVTSHANTHPCSNYFGPGHGSPAVASLVMLGDKGEALPTPEDPVKTAAIVMPAEEFKPAEGVPVLDLPTGKVPGQWLYAGPMPRKSRNDVLGAIGGYGRARPKPGTEVRSGVMIGDKVEMTTLTFKAMPAEMMKDGAIDLERLAPAGGASTTILHTVLRVKEKQIVSFFRDSSDTRVWLNGTEVAAGNYYSLRPGLYPLTVVHATDKTAGTIAPRFEALGSEAGAEGVALHKLEMALWESYKAQCEKTSASTLNAQVADLGWLRMYQHYRLGIGDGGFQAETGSYAMIASWFPAVYAACHRNVLGRDASGDADVTNLMVRRMMQVLFKADGSTEVQKLNSVVGFDTGWIATTFRIIPDQYKPAVLWAWNKVQGVTGPDTTPNILGTSKRGLGGVALAFAFVNYPLGMQPEHPAKVMPLMWEASTFGHYTFRSGWQSDDDFVGQAFAKAHNINGWSHPNAGTFRLLGLGHEWVVGSTNRVGFRDHEPCVHLPENEINQGACGRVAALQTAKDGSAVITIDLKDVYSSHDGRLYDGNLLRNEKALVDSGISGLRSLAFDYSRASGAPAMLVVVDKITGGKKRIWQWSLPKGTAAKTKADDRGFTFDYGDASLRVTFVTPSPVKLHVGADSVALGAIGDKHRSYEGVIERVTAEGDGDFFVVATVQRGAAPAVNVEGQGLGATVKIGGQTVRFDGQKVVLGKFGQ